jgi:CspA family cold shock protein
MLEYERRMAARPFAVVYKRRRRRREMSDATAVTQTTPASANGEKLEGKVKWYNEARGFGFIGREGQPDVFMHVSALKKAGLPEIKEGDPVRFRVETTKRGQQATDIELVVGA